MENCGIFCLVENVDDKYMVVRLRSQNLDKPVIHGTKLMSVLNNALVNQCNQRKYTTKDSLKGIFEFKAGGLLLIQIYSYKLLSLTLDVREDSFLSLVELRNSKSYLRVRSPFRRWWCMAQLQLPMGTQQLQC